MFKIKEVFNKIKNIDKNYFIIVGLSLLFIFITIYPGSFFGSNVDWINQHVPFADYFRKLFYSTKNLFPNLAFNIGGGQNIYNFSYYGLYNPYIIISYLLPHIKMITYIQVINIIIYPTIGCLLYYFLKKHFSKNISVITTIIIISSASILFHLHRQYMFVNYLPFLILALIGVDKYFKNGNKSFLIINVFLIIMTSYYYSITSMIVIIIYVVYKYYSSHDKLDKEIVLGIIKDFFIIFMTSILMASILLLPTMGAILNNGRSKTTNTIPLIYLLIPKANISAFVYERYTLGLTVISIVSVIYYLFDKSKNKSIVSLIILIIFNFPIIIYILNGALYDRSKILIPFIPLIGIFIASFLEDVLSKKVNLKKIFIIGIILVFLFSITSFDVYLYELLFYIDVFILIFFIYLYYYDLIPSEVLLTIILIIPICILLYSSLFDIPVIKSDYNSYDVIDAKKTLDEASKKENDIVRYDNIFNEKMMINGIYNSRYYISSLYSSVYNKRYKNFLRNTLKNPVKHRNELMLEGNHNIFSQTILGEKYVYNNYASVGYKIKKEDVVNNLYVNNNVLPVLYGSSTLLNIKEYKKIKYPYNMEVLVNNVVTNSASKNKYKITMKKEKLDYKVVEKTNIDIRKKDNIIYIRPRMDNYLKLSLDKPLKKEVLVISFKLLNRAECYQGDSKIYINGTTNTLSCKDYIYDNHNNVFHYVISSEITTKNLKIKFNPDINYKITDIKTYRMSYDSIKNVKNNIYEFKVNRKKTNGDYIYGTINMKENGYFVTSIPYDKGYYVKVDGKRVKTEIVNTAFLGFKLSKGEHVISIHYVAPFSRVGKLLSIIGLALLMVIIKKENKKVS